MPSIQKVPVRPGRIVTLSRGCFRRKGRMLRAPAGLQVRQLRRRVRVHVFQRKAFLGLAIFRSWGIFTLVVVILTFICYTMKEPWMAYSKRDA